MTYTYENTNGWRNLPGPGDEETWGPCTGHPNDPRTPEAVENTDIFQGVKEDLYRKKVQDLNGYFIESLTESTDEWLKQLSDLCLQWGDVPADRVKDIELEIGRLVARRVDEYCSPDDDEVREAMPEPDDGGDRAYDEWKDRQLEDSVEQARRQV